MGMEADVTRLAAGSVLFLAASLSSNAGPLHHAARDGDVAEAKAEIDSGAEINGLDENGETPLTLAILNGQSAATAFLLERGADIEARNRGGFTPLHAAAYVDDVDAAERLLAKGADVGDRRNKAGVSPLSVAAEQGHVAVARVLIERGADLEAGDQNGYTALSRALWRGQENVVVLLQESGAMCQPEEILGEPVHSECVAGRP